jgi:hypothetical protein
LTHRKTRRLRRVDWPIPCSRATRSGTALLRLLTILQRRTGPCRTP